MKFIRDLSRNYAFDPQHYWFLNQVDGEENVNVYFGINCNKGLQCIEQCNKEQNKEENKEQINIYIDIEMPNFTFLKYNDYYDMCKNYTYIFGICPWTCKMLNQLLNTDKFIYTKLFIPKMTFPIEIGENEKIEEKEEKILYTESNIQVSKAFFKIMEERSIPVIYTGSNVAVSRFFFKIMDEINGKNKTDEIIRTLAVKKNETYIEKLKLLNKTKISIVHNVLESNLPNKHNFPHLSQFYPFFYENEFPQVKTRILEASLMGTIMLCKRDKYNLIEEYFTENEDFIYFNDDNDLREKIHMILNDYEKYQHLASNAQKKCIENYTEEKFIDNIKQLLSSRNQ